MPVDQSFTHFIEWVFYGVVGGAAVYGVAILASMKTSIESLNEKIAVLFERSLWHEKELVRHGDEINQLKNKE